MATHSPGISLSVSFEADCDPVPAIPRDRVRLVAEVVGHRKMGKVALNRHPNGALYVNGKEVVRRLSEEQRLGANVRVQKLYERWKGMETLNFCLLLVLLEHQDLIPEEWKIGHTYFWGTVFQDNTHRKYVFSLFWNDGWVLAYNEFGDMLEFDCYAAMLAA